MKDWYKISVYGLLVVLVFSCGHPGKNDKGILIYSQDFESGQALHDFSFFEPDLWQIVSDSSGNSYLDAKERGNYHPPHRSPSLIALIDSVSVSDFVLEADLMQKQVEHDCQGENCVFCMHRDMCVFWAFRDSSHYYYAHIARRGDEVAHQVHIVNDAPRTPVTVRRNKGVDWGENEWKHVKVIRSIEDTLLQVFFEDMKTPVLEARDNTFISGRIGFGSFDEAGSIDHIRLYSGE